MTTILRDQQHAARLFTDDHFRLAPKHKFLFHVAFSINPGALTDINLLQRHRNEINMLVKSTDLPSFGITVETLNQYNRKKNVQTVMKYNPISISFHDDNMGLINKVWQNYFNYYYADPSSAGDPGAYDRTATKNFSYTNNAYGLDNSSNIPFFNYIKIYQMAKHEYVSYKLLNPIIESWNHNKVDYAQDGIHDNTMTIKYEAVSYESGSVTQGDPEGFAQEHYDLTPSPNKELLDQSTENNPSFVSNMVLDRQEYANNLVDSINHYQNSHNILNTSTTAGVINSAISKQTSSLNGLYFPLAEKTPTTTTQATLINFK
jgi:hypothetical protein